MKLCHEIEIDCRDITKSIKKEICPEIENSIATEASKELENLCCDRSPYVAIDHSNINTARHETMSRHQKFML